MASFTLNTVGTFPEGTSVSAYPVSNWGGRLRQDAAPVGSATNTQTVSSQSVTFTGLSTQTTYVAYGLVGSTHRYTQFYVGPEPNRIPDGSLENADFPDNTITLAKLTTATKADWEYAYSTYKPLTQITNYIGNSAATGTYLAVLIGGFIVSAANFSSLGTFPFDPANYSAGTRTTKLRLVGSIFVSNVAVGASNTLKVGLYPVTNSNNALVAATAGTVVTGSQGATLTGAAAGSTTVFDSTDFTAPAAGNYGIGVVVGGAAIAASSYVTIAARLLVRQV